MDQGSLVREQIDAGAKFLSEFQKYAPIQVAFWLRESDEDQWYLYIASEQITDENFDVAYGEVIRIAIELGDPMFDTFQVKVIGADNRLAKALLDVHQRYPRRNLLHFRDKYFGSLHIEEVYIYPSPILLSA